MSGSRLSSALGTYSNYRHDTMTSFLELLDKNYGGVEEYLKKYINLSDDEINRIRENILVPSANL
ncbi:hypothetical protein PTI98_005479 [Pleurotus ostreatus]|nr:hypothetical protein PTI98_005479 [Pleurotus ostreatus]